MGRGVDTVPYDGEAALEIALGALTTDRVVVIDDGQDSLQISLEGHKPACDGEVVEHREPALVEGHELACDGEVVTSLPLMGR